jgi:hypothetical protein
MGVDAATDRLQEALDLSEFLVAAHVGALTLVDEVPTTFSINIKRSRDRIEVGNKIIRAVTSVTVDGDARDAADYNTGVRHWTIESVLGFTKGVDVVVVYESGYENEAGLPDRMKQAILATAAEVHRERAGSSGLTSEKIGDYSWTAGKNEKGDSPLPMASQVLLEEFTKPK